MNTIVEQNCAICGLPRTEGIRIVTGFICASCEHEMVRTDALDERYPYFITQMRHMFFEKNA